ncbi:Tigger transposable element-derived protein 1 [Eumeta japonica]|uniref:Tigger transposable element-derived protein 1 n=1 Tax=Eumeta variegata TaxID=151549 RepID=A0A4C1ZQW4_EUMVA|nr:Tigger transposable element-derived protein 1 [Eumeta japonica]
MLDRLRLGESFASISRLFNVNESTVRSIKKSEDKIRSSVASTSLSAKIVRDPAIEKMEVALSLWIEDRNQKRVPLSGPMVREKAKRLYAHFKEPDGSFSDFKALLVLDNAPGHPRELETMHPNIKVTFLPPNTTALLQPMDQGIIQAFKLYYIRRTFKITLDNMECNPDMNTMECWKKFDIAKCIVNIKESLE